MSAVFMLAIAPLPHYLGGVSVLAARGEVPLSDPAVMVRRIAEQRLAAFSDEAIADALLDPSGGDIGPRATAENLVSRFLDRVFADLGDDTAPRFWESECEHLTLRGVPYVACGDYSHGDMPEGVFEEIEVVARLGLFDEPVLNHPWQLDCPHDDVDLVLTEEGYVRTWGTHIDRAAGVLTATSSGSSDWSDEGDGEEYLQCRECGAVLPVPEGFTINWQ